MLIGVAESLVTETDESFDFGGTVGELGDVVLRASDHAVHDHIEDIGGVEAHDEAWSSLED